MAREDTSVSFVATKNKIMKKLFIGIAIWNTIVALINAFVLPLYMSEEMLVFITPKSQLLPIFIPLIIAFWKEIVWLWDSFDSPLSYR